MFDLKNHENENNRSEDTDIGSKNYQDKRVNYYKDKYLDDYVNRIEANLREQGSRITRNEIMGYVLEKLSEYKTRNISVTNGNYRLKIAMGEPDDLADKFLKVKRKMKPIKEVDESEIRRKTEENNYFRSLSTSEKIKYRINKIKYQLSNIKSVDNSLVQKLLVVNGLHIVLLIFNIIIAWMAFGVIINIFQGSVSSRYQLRRLSENIIWYPENMLYIEFGIFILYFITSLVFRNEAIEQIGYAETWGKRIKHLYIFNFIRFISQVLFNFVGSLISINGNSLNYFSSDNITTISMISLFAHVLIIITLVKSYNFEVEKHEISDKYMYNGKIGSLIAKILYRPLQIAMYFSTLYHLIFAIIYYQLFQLISEIGVDNGLFISPSVNYSLLVINLVLFALSMMVLRLSPSMQKIDAIKKRTRNQSLIQLVLNIIANAYFYTIYSIFVNAGRERELISFDEILISTIFYYITIIGILFLNRRLRGKPNG